MPPVVRPLREDELPAADRIFRQAFGTFLGLPDPLAFAGDSDWVRGRWRAEPEAALAVEVDGELAGSSFVTRWGSVGFFGPLTVRPDLWDRGLARRLLEPTMELLAAGGVRHAGLYTFAQSPKHVALYGRFGFWPRFLTAIMSKPLRPREPAPRWTGYSTLPAAERETRLAACRDLTGALYPGLDVGREIRAVEAQRLGETVLLDAGERLAGFAVCHAGAGSEAGSGACYVKFAAVRPGPEAERHFDALLAACEALAAARGASLLIAGTNLARVLAYQRLLAGGFRTQIQGVAMHRPNEPGYSRPEVLVIDDWR
jgi:GNAT superfamily N-acetyltransferase